jgi:CheY-like chemotaxis protein
MKEKIMFEQKQIEKPAFHGEILLCEDDKMNQQIICRHLEKAGLKTVVAVNGREGVEAVRNRIPNRFDLIFMDIQMPVMNGLEATAEILKMNTGTPIIAMAANAAPPDRELYAAHGMSDCVGKPFTSQQLLDCLLKHLTPVNQNVADEKPENDEIFRRKLMRIFIDEHKNKYNEIKNAINSGDIKQAKMLAHALKGVSGYMDKTALQEAAKNIDNRLKDGNNAVTPEDLNKLKTELDAALDEFTAKV